METQMTAKQPAQLMQVLSQTAPAAIPELDFVQKKYVQNYNLAHGNNMGELMYHRQLIHFKALLNSSDAIKNCDPFSLYAVFVTAAVNGYSFDVEDQEIYVVTRGGKAAIQRQAGAHVKRLMRTRQIMFADNVKLVYEGDDFGVEMGIVTRHVERFQSEKIVAGYVRFQLDKAGTSKYFIYRKSDWEAWRMKSPNKNGDTWVFGELKQPQAAFLRTKILLHACKEKSWAIGMVDPRVEQFPVEFDPDEDETNNATETTTTTENNVASATTPPPPSIPASTNPEVIAATIQATASNEEYPGSPVNHADDSTGSF